MTARSPGGVVQYPDAAIAARGVNGTKEWVLLAVAALSNFQYETLEWVACRLVRSMVRWRWRFAWKGAIKTSKAADLIHYQPERYRELAGSSRVAAGRRRS